MIFFGEDGSGSFLLENALTVEINSELGVPADDMTVSFSCDSVPHLRRIYAAKDGASSLEQARARGALLFAGIVDEQVTSVEPFGSTVTVYARSLAALPLDNECESGQYVDPTLEVMFKKHLERFGIKSGSKLRKSCSGGVMNISKGQSHYAAVRKFCTVFLGTIPRVDSVGVFRSDVYETGETVVFGSGGVDFIGMTVRERRCVRVSCVTAVSNGGVIRVRNRGAEGDGIIREKRISLLDSSTGTLSDADSIIKSGERKRLTVSLRCVGMLGDIVGSKAKLDRDGFSTLSFVVVKTKYKAGQGGDTTDVVLALSEKE